MFACFTNNNGHIHQSIHFLRLKTTIDKVPKSLLNHLNKEEVETHVRGMQGKRRQLKIDPLIIKINHWQLQLGS